MGLNRFLFHALAPTPPSPFFSLHRSFPNWSRSAFYVCHFFCLRCFLLVRCIFLTIIMQLCTSSLLSSSLSSLTNKPLSSIGPLLVNLAPFMSSTLSFLRRSTCQMSATVGRSVGRWSIDWHRRHTKKPIHETKQNNQFCRTSTVTNENWGRQHWDQCDQIWQNFGTFRTNWSTWQFLQGLFCMRQIFKPHWQMFVTLENFLCC